MGRVEAAGATETDVSLWTLQGSLDGSISLQIDGRGNRPSRAGVDHGLSPSLAWPRAHWSAANAAPVARHRLDGAWSRAAAGRLRVRADSLHTRRRQRAQGPHREAE